MKTAANILHKFHFVHRTYLFNLLHYLHYKFYDLHSYIYSIHTNYIFATSWFFCLFLPTSPFKAVCENEAIKTVNSLIRFPSNIL